MDAIRMEVIHQAARERAQAPWGQRGAPVERAASVLGLSVQRTHTLVARVSQALTLAAPRQRRSDAGNSAVSLEELRMISGAMTHDRRAGKWMLSCKDAIEMLVEDGKLSTRLSPERIGQLLRERGLHPKQLAAPAPAVRMRTEHVNALWEIDASVCVLYRTPKGELLHVKVDCAAEVGERGRH